MKVLAVNIGERKLVKWRGKAIETGIFKYPVDHPIHLENEDVVGDSVVDRRYHGGIEKACYIYSADHYPLWKEKYPELDWNCGMFGENITVKGMQERQIQIGDIYEIGECRVQVTQPREPCFKLGIRFGTQKVLKDFIALGLPGVYVKIIESGLVNVGDEMRLSERLHNAIGVNEVWELMYNKTPDMEELEFAVDFQHLGESFKSGLRKRLAKG